MALVILLMISIWFIPEPFPLALRILVTIFGGLHCLVVLIKAGVETHKKRQQPRKTGYGLLDKFLDN